MEIKAKDIDGLIPNELQSNFSGHFKIGFLTACEGIGEKILVIEKCHCLKRYTLTQGFTQEYTKCNGNGFTVRIK